MAVVTNVTIKAQVHVVCSAGAGQPPTVAWKDMVGTEVRKQIPASILDSWQSIALTVDEKFHAAESSLRIKLQSEIDRVNTIRAADRSTYPDETFFALAGANPDPLQVIYIWNNGVRICIHQYALNLGTNPWQVEDPKNPAKTVGLALQLCWETKVA